MQAAAFNKPGNNGTVSCNTFCGAAQASEQAVWGSEIASCVRGRAALFVKHGNDGTVSCNTYCQGAQWGDVGTCVAGFNNKRGVGAECSTTPGQLGCLEFG